MSEVNVKLVDVEVVMRQDRELSYGIEDPNNEGHLIFIPKSQAEYDEEDGLLTLPEWLAKEKGLV